MNGNGTTNAIDRSDARSVRAANAVPICPATIPTNTIVTACRYAECNGVRRDGTEHGLSPRPTAEGTTHDASCVPRPPHLFDIASTVQMSLTAVTATVGEIALSS